jgi:hypothetical protein
MNPKTLAEQIEFLNVGGLTGPELCLAARVASACGDLQLARKLREIHDADVFARRSEMTASIRRSNEGPHGYFE